MFGLLNRIRVISIIIVVIGFLCTNFLSDVDEFLEICYLDFAEHFPQLSFPDIRSFTTISYEDNAIRAVRAAEEMISSLVKVNIRK